MRWVYDANNRIIEIDINNVYLWKCKYDEEGRAINVETKGPQTGQTETMQYNPQGDVSIIQRITQVSSDVSTIEIVSNTYEYDSHGNWIKKTSIIDNKKIVTKSRSIEYYD